MMRPALSNRILIEIHFTYASDLIGYRFSGIAVN